MKCPFKVGDFVINTTEMYALTNMKVVCQVVDLLPVAVNGDHMVVVPVKITCGKEEYLEYEEGRYVQGWDSVHKFIRTKERCPVNSSRFTRYQDDELTAMEVC